MSVTPSPTQVRIWLSWGLSDGARAIGQKRTPIGCATPSGAEGGAQRAQREVDERAGDQRQHRDDQEKAQTGPAALRDPDLTALALGPSEGELGQQFDLELAVDGVGRWRWRAHPHTVASAPTTGIPAGKS